MILSSERQSIIALVERSKSLFAAGRYEDNLALMTKARDAHPDSPEIQLEFALAVADFDPEKGLEEVQRVLRLRPLDPLIELGCGFLLLNLGNPQGARDCVNKIRASTPDDWPWNMDLLHLGGRIALAAGNRELAEPLLAGAFEGEPENPDNGLFLARLYRDGGDEQRARRVAEEALRYSPDNRRLLEFADEDFSA
jgi:tetratricopeptide (TPR) repeat protein